MQQDRRVLEISPTRAARSFLARRNASTARCRALALEVLAAVMVEDPRNVRAEQAATKATFVIHQFVVPRAAFP
ncbi:hypothetical protein AWB94_31460 [Mycolicibacterium canariasense]|nr:hypothetical protein AWB94_31460 [Mycolicibacterium canariasense]